MRDGTSIHAHRAAFVVGSLATLIACGDARGALENDAGSAAVDAAMAGGDGGGGPFGSLPTSVDVGEGGRRIFLRAGALADAALEVRTFGRVRAMVELGRVVVRADYGADPDAALEFVLPSGSHRVALNVTPMVWTAAPAWVEGETGPTAREYAAFWLDDAVRDRAFLFGGFVYEPEQFTPSRELWELGLESLTWRAWGELANVPASPGGRVASTGEPGVALYHGGGLPDRTTGGLTTPKTLARLDVRGASPAWVDAPGQLDAPGSYTGALIFDRARSRWLSICGADADSVSFACNVDALSSDGVWTRFDFGRGARPGGRYGFHYAFDEEGERVVIFGGQVGGSNEAVGGDTWILDLGGVAPTWHRVSREDEAAPLRRNGGFVFDSDGRRLFVWGGTPNGATTVAGIQVFELDSGFERWVSLEVPAHVPPRTSAAAIFDASRKRLVMGFGNSTEGVFPDLWTVALGEGGVVPL